MRWQVVFDVVFDGPQEVDAEAQTKALARAKEHVFHDRPGVEIMIRPLSAYRAREREMPKGKKKKPRS